MMTLLFALFVVLFSLKDDGGEDQQLDQAAAAVGESFNMVMEDIPVERRVGPTETGYGIFEHMRGDQLMPPISKKFPGNKQSIKQIDDDMGRVMAELDQRLYGPNKFQSGKKGGEGQKRVVSVHREPDGFRVQMLARHFFKSGDYKIRKSATRELDEVAKILKDLGRRVTIEGHTDSLPSSGRLSNWDISALRSSHVLRHFIGKHYFPATKIAAAGYADTRPVAHNGTEAGRSMNRRIEIKISYDD